MLPASEVESVNSARLFRPALSEWASFQNKNKDFWQRLFAACLRHDVELIWVKGRAGIRDNERCDQLSVEARMGNPLPPDEGYQQSGEADEMQKVYRTESLSC